MTTRELDVPRKLEVVDGLSVSSLRLLWNCPEKWRRRYVLGEYEAPTGPMVAGSCVGAAEAQHYATQIETGEGLSTADVLDALADEWADRTSREEIDWQDTKPDELRKRAEGALGAYHERIAPTVTPTSVEREFQLEFPGVDWTFRGFLDLEDSAGNVADLKLKARKMGQGDADSDPQAASYLLARRTEGNPALGFEFHTMIRTKEPQAEVVRTRRTDAQLDTFLHRIYASAAEIAWRLEFDVWQGAAPGNWMCSSRSCGYWRQCRFGGKS